MSGETIAEMLVEIGCDISGLLEGLQTAKGGIDEFGSTAAISADKQEVFGQRVSERLRLLARDYETLGQSEAQAAASAEAARGAIEQSVATAAQRRVNNFAPSSSLQPLDEAVSTRLEQVAAQYRLLGQSQTEATASAERLRPAVQDAVSEQAQVKLERLVPTLKEVGESANPLAGIFNKFGEEFKNIGTMAAGMATGMLAANVVMGVTERLKNASEAIDTFGTAVRKVQVVTGATAEDSSRLVAVFERYGLTGDDAANKLSRFERSLNGTETALDLQESGGKRGAQVLQEFGVQTRDATGHVLPMIDVLLKLSERWKDMDAISRNDAARALFGGLGGAGGEQMNLLLSQGKDQLESVIAAAERYGLVLSGENLKDVVAFTVAHREMDMALQGLSVQLGAAFMPAITSTAEALSSLTKTVVSDLVPVIKALPGWIIPVGAGLVGLSIASQLFWSATKLVFNPVMAAIGAISGEGTAAAVATPRVAALATAQVAAGTTAAAATPEIAAMGAAGTGAAAGIGAIASAAASAAAAVAGLVTALAAAAAMPIIGINAEQTAGDVNKRILDALSDDQRKQAQDYINANMQTIADAGGGQITQTGERFVLENWLKQQGIDENALIGGGADPSSLIDKIKTATDQVGKSITDQLPKIPTADSPGEAVHSDTPSASVKAAQAAADAAKARLQQLQDEQNGRKLDFDSGHVEMETDALNAKLAETQANAQLLDYKRQIEDLDRSALDYAHQRVKLDEQDAVTRAQIAESAAKAQDEDLGYQQNLLKAELRASRHGGAPVDSSAIHAELRQLHDQQIRETPGLLVAQHNVSLADRAKQSTDQQDQLKNNQLARAKIDIEEAMQPFLDAATAAKRIAETAQSTLDMEKQKFAIEEQRYQLALLQAQLEAKKADHALYAAQHPEAGAGAGVTINGGVNVTVTTVGQQLDHMKIVDDVYYGITQAARDAKSGPVVLSPKLGGSRYATT